MYGPSGGDGAEKGGEEGEGGDAKGGAECITSGNGARGMETVDGGRATGVDIVGEHV